MTTTLARELAEEIFYEYQQDAVVGDKVRVTRNGKTFYRAKPGKGKKGKKVGIKGKGKKRGVGKALAIAGGLAATGALAAGGAYALNPSVRKKTNAVAGRVKKTASQVGEEVKGGGQDLKKTKKSFVRRSKKVAQKAGLGRNEPDVKGKQKPSASVKETLQSEGKVVGAAGKEVGRTIRNRSQNIGQILKEGAQGIGSEFQGSRKKKKGGALATVDSLETLSTALSHIEDYKAGHPNYYIPKTNYVYSR